MNKFRMTDATFNELLVLMQPYMQDSRVNCNNLRSYSNIHSLLLIQMCLKRPDRPVAECSSLYRFRLMQALFQSTRMGPSPKNRPGLSKIRVVGVRYIDTHLYLVIGTCTNNGHRDKSTATSKFFGHIKSKLNVFNR